MNEYKTGDKVRLRSGGPQMTVGETVEDSANCAWFVGSERRTAWFPFLSLESSPERQPEGNTEVLGEKLLRAKLPPEVLSRIEELERAQQIEALPELIAACRTAIMDARHTQQQIMAPSNGISMAPLERTIKLCEAALVKAGVKL